MPVQPRYPCHLYCYIFTCGIYIYIYVGSFTHCCAVSQERREAGFDDADVSDTETRPLSERIGAIDGGQLLGS